VLLAVCLSMLSAQQKRPMQTGDLFAIQRLSAPALSPDGKWVAYVVGTADLAANKNLSDLWISAVDGSQTRRLTANPASDGNPVWSPDGRWIAFESSRSGEGQIWMLPADGGEPRQFTTLSTGASQPVWAPDGKSVAFVSAVFPEYSDRPFLTSDSLNRIALDRLEKGAVKAEVFTGLLYRHWNDWVHGKRLHIFVQPFPSGTPIDLTPGNRDAVPSSSTFSAGTDFAFSPDGKEIAYTATPLPVREEAWSTNHDLFVVPVAGGTPKQLTTNPAADGYPRYSPDGKYIAYRAQKRPGFEADRWQLMLLDRAKGTSRSLTDNFDSSVETPVWSPDGKALYFPAEAKANKNLYAVTLKGNDVRAVVSGGYNTSVCVSPDSRTLLFSRSSAVRAAELFRVVADGSGLTAVTSFNDTVFAKLEIPAPESITWAGEGGTSIQGWLYKPPGFDPAKKYPLVMMVHGGPQGATENGWHYRWNMALWAAQGYVIFAPNPRGSTGFGQQFVDEISGDWGGRVFTDLMKGLDYVQAMPFIDARRTAAAGASFGGYMVNWFQAKVPERFATLITHCGVYNFVSMYGATDEVWFDEWDHGGTPWDKPEEYARFSPHSYAKNFKTPHLIIHGAYDFRIPYTEAMQLFTALQRQGVPSKFVFFHDESHFVAKPANSEFWHNTVFGWLAQYLR
jgi:dipeptidyl aminopeptidase/acylaminoacyl peptidase